MLLSSILNKETKKKKKRTPQVIRFLDINHLNHLNMHMPRAKILNKLLFMAMPLWQMFYKYICRAWNETHMNVYLTKFMVVDNITTCHVSKPVSYILISTTTTTTTATATTNSCDAASEGETERHKTTINFSYLLNFSCVFFFDFLEKRLTYDCGTL